MTKFKVVAEGDMTKDPCKECGKTSRQDFYGYCMDCADENGISDLFSDEDIEKNLELLNNRLPTPAEKEANLKKMAENLEKKNKGEEL